MDTQRRSILKAGAAVCAGALGDALGLGRFFRSGEAAAQSVAPAKAEAYFYSACLNNCGNACILKVFHHDGKVTRIETDNEVEDDWENGIFQIRACPRGRSMRRHMYSPSRLRYPMKRVGKRGEAAFERISWDEALDIVAAKLRYCIDTFGNASILHAPNSGVYYGPLLRPFSFIRLMNLLGGYTEPYTDYSSPMNQAGLLHLYGIPGYSGNAITDIRHSRLAVLFGSNIVETRMSGGGLQYEMFEARKQGKTRIIIIDPRYTESCTIMADEWIPIRPGTDAALASALAFVLMRENMVDMDFVRTHCVGYDPSTLPDDAPQNASYADYILGTGYDKQPKTPEWAAPITGIPVARIYQLAREIGQAKPCYISQGWGPQRAFAGEWTTTAIAALAVITGNLGIRGGNNGDFDRYFPGPAPVLPTGVNPQTATFPQFMWPQAVLDGKGMTPANAAVKNADAFPSDIKFIWNYAGNRLINQHSDINHTRKVLGDESKCEMLVVMDTHLTSTARWADILLPSCAYPEVEDLYSSGWGMDIDYFLASGKVEAFFEARPIWEVCRDLAGRLGVEEAFTESKSREQWLQQLMDEQIRPYYPHLPATLEEVRKAGVIRKAKSRDFPVPMEDFRKDPVAHPLTTPSGKIELYSQTLAELSRTRETGRYLGDRIPPVPQYIVTWEGFEDAEAAKKYPLQMITNHYKGQTHSHYANVDWLREVLPQTLWINPLDATERGIRHGDLLKVWNDRGTLLIKAKVTRRIIPGVVCMPQGSWYNPDKNGVDHGACPNTLTAFRPTALARSNPMNTNRVQVAKA